VSMNRIEVVTSVERRRRWSSGDKTRLVSALNEPGSVASEIAREAGVDVSLLYRWRRQLAMADDAPTFVPVQVTPDPGSLEPMSAPVCEPPSPPPPTSITISIGTQVRVTVEGAPDAATLMRVIGALRDGRR
jgi:transposase